MPRRSIVCYRFDELDDDVQMAAIHQFREQCCAEGDEDHTLTLIADGDYFFLQDGTPIPQDISQAIDERVTDMGAH
jgi:hypothetical protein